MDALLRQKYRVIGFDDLSTGSPHNLSNAILHDDFTFVEGDIRDGKAIAQACEDCDVVIHLAAVTKVAESLRNPQKYIDINVTGTQCVLTAAVQAQVDRVVFASSAAVYGTPETVPIPEDAATQPLSPYGHSKLEGERLCQSTAADHGMTIPQLRLFNVFGSRQSVNNEAGVVSIFLNRAKRGLPLTIFGDGNQTRDFIYIDDAVEAFIRASTLNTVPSVPVNVGTGIPVSIQELVETIQDLVPSCPPAAEYKPTRPGDIYHSVAEITRMQQLLAYTPDVSLREGLARICQAEP